MGNLMRRTFFAVLRVDFHQIRSMPAELRSYTSYAIPQFLFGSPAALPRGRLSRLPLRSSQFAVSTAFGVRRNEKLIP